MTRLPVAVLLGTVLTFGIACSEPTKPEPRIDAAAIVAISVASWNATSAQVMMPVPTFEVRDASGAAVADVPVTVTVTSGGGSLTAPAKVSLAGPTPIGQWMLGNQAGPQSVTVRVDGVEPLVISVNAVASAYHIDLRYRGTPPSASVQQAFTNAVIRIRGAISGDIPGNQVNALSIETRCVPSGPVVLNEFIDDLLIFVSVDSIDGVGEVLGSAGPCYVNDDASTTVIGSMRFDAADMPELERKGLLETVILHEMLHVIGVGTLWGDLLVDPQSAGVRFTGTQARDACASLAGGAAPCAEAVPVENCLDLAIGQTCGAGTRDAHWKESIFRSELMTGYLGTGDQPLSSFTLLSLADIGYQVNPAAASAYVVPSPAFAALRAADEEPGLRMPAPFRPHMRIQPDGRAVPLAARR
ncbi:MAG: leishmanolysin-related zinc metalloendopeptidase [Gemmatimonadaceae bacterium]